MVIVLAQIAGIDRDELMAAVMESANCIIEQVKAEKAAMAAKAAQGQGIGMGAAQQAHGGVDYDDLRKIIAETTAGLDKVLESRFGSVENSPVAVEARKSAEQPQQTSNYTFSKNSVRVNGSTLEYKVLKKDVDWGDAFNESKSMDDKITNLEKLQDKILEDLVLTFGSLDRIKTVVVVSGMMIVNGIQYHPVCRSEAFLNGLSLDCRWYLEAGLVAEIFDFGHLHKMPYLTTIKIDSMDFVTDRFAYDIGITGEFTLKAVFKLFRNLKLFEVGDITAKAPGVIVGDADGRKEKLVREKVESRRFIKEAYDKYITANTKTFTGWTVNNLKTYACNRGDKGFFKYTGGIIARLGLSAVVGTGHLGLKAVGFVASGVFNTVKDAVKSCK